MNPFAQPEKLWLLSCVTKFKNLSLFEDFLEENAYAISSYEVKSETIDSMPEDEWAIEAYFGEMIDPEIVLNGLMHLVLDNSIQIKQVEEKDWAEVAASSLGEIETDKFHIIRSISVDISNKIPIILNLTRAFGTGEHATTIGCLEAMESISHFPVKRVLDIGTGTGILAIASKKLWHDSYVTATDIDPVSIEISKTHSNINNVELELYVMDGISDLGRKEKYDLIVSNILARPLISMAKDISNLVKKGGHVILSGFLENQMKEIIECYKAENLFPSRCSNKNNWITLILRK